MVETNITMKGFVDEVPKQERYVCCNCHKSFPFDGPRYDVTPMNVSLNEWRVSWAFLCKSCVELMQQTTIEAVG